MKKQHFKNTRSRIQVGAPWISLEFDKFDGSVYGLQAGEIDINLSPGNKLEEYSCVNFFLGLNGAVRVPLLNTGRLLRGAYNDTSVFWEGVVEELRFKISFLSAQDDPVWYWTVGLQNNSSAALSVDLIYCMDKGLAPRALSRSNEFYNSHYIDCHPLEDPEGGVALASRQNRSVAMGKVPWLLEGCLNGTIGYATDAEDFYGNEYRITGIPQAAKVPLLASRVLQGQYSISALQSKPVQLEAAQETEIVFFGMYRDEHSAATSSEDRESLTSCRKLWSALERYPYSNFFSIPRSPKPFSKSLIGLPLFEEELNTIFGKQRLHSEHGKDGQLWSFFTEDSHVVLQEKDRHLSMPHGHIIRGGEQLMPDETLLSANCHMQGCFASQMAVGNSLFQSFLSCPHGQYDLVKGTGLRVAVEQGAELFLLGMPSAFVMKMNAAEWIYKTKQGLLVLSSHIDHQNNFCFSLKAAETSPMNFVLYIGLSYDEDSTGGSPAIEIQENKQILLVAPRKNDFSMSFSNAKISFAGTPAAKNIELLGDSPGIIALTLPRAHHATLSVSIHFSKSVCPVVRKNSGKGVEDFLHPARISWASGGDLAAVQKLNSISRWWAHNTLVHFSVMHGLEQSQGGAWGIRDVVQGPFEALLAQENWEALREILVMVFAAQSWKNGDWPQWFMLDSYQEIRDSHCHGDIIYWPLKAFCEYLEASADTQFLYHLIPYTKNKGHALIKCRPVWEHLIDALDAIKRSYLVQEYGLLRYGGGDWNDTLQPVNAEKRKQLVSVWTMGLALQYLGSLSRIAKEAAPAQLFEKATEVYDAVARGVQGIIKTYPILPGFLQIGDTVQAIIHPDDTHTGPRYRLLPMLRFISARIFSHKQAREHLRIIEEQLWHPDGVKLLDRPIMYRGGKSHTFVRAEQSAFWGREVGLMYVHAHIWFIEALLSLGEAEKAWKALNQIIPIELEKFVKNAAPRQANAYFSSSDALFRNRKNAEEDYAAVADGEIMCRGGWRIYSSGPGLLLSLIKRYLFGYSYKGEYVCIDPVLPRALRGTQLCFSLYTGKALSLHLVAPSGAACGVSEILVNKKRVSFIQDSHPYRKGGAKILREKFFALLDQEKNTVKVILD